MPPMRSATKKKISGVTLPSFRQEWSLLLNTLSPYVIWVIDAKSQTYVMEYAHKGDLAHALGWLQPPPRPIVPNILNTSKGIPKLITEHKFRPGTDDDLIVCLTIVLQVAKGLRELRDQADLKVYFDVKLSNILIWKYKYREDIPEVRVHMKLTDLGTAAGPLAVGGGGSSFFRCRECLNTRHPISEKCDVFALGRLLWFLIMYVRGEYKLTIDDGAKPPPPGDTDVTKLTPEELKEILYKTIPGDRYEALREVYDETQDYKIEYEDFIGKLIRIRRPLTANLRIHEPIKSSLWQHLWHDTLKTIHGWPRKIISAMSLFFILACFTGFTPPVIEINGTVKDAMAKTPISGAKLTIDNEEVATTEEDGSYFTAVPLNHRKHEIQAYHENYKEQSRPLDITVKRSVANFILPLKNISIDPVIIKVIEKEVVIRTPEIPNVPPESPRKPAPFWYFASMYKVTVSYDNVKPFTGDYRNGYWIYKIPREQTGVLIDGEQSLSRWGPGTVEDMPEEEAVKAAVNEPVFIANTDIYELSEEELYQRSMKEEESAKKDSSGKHLLKAIRYLEAAVEKAPGNIKFLKSLRTQYGMARKDNKAEEISRRIKSLESGD
ncbi:hypothetical protein FJZ33_04425 [Candidatus Poribacteria bacterium]|nr:hypothetical protein [Candidatus Poribacteria bacterium]